MPDRVRPTRTSALTALVAIVACSGGGSSPSGPGPGGTPSLHVVAGNGSSDTALARSAQPVIVEVHGPTGAPVSGLAVQFDAMRPADPARQSQRALWVCPPTTAACGAADEQTVTVVSDAAGRASVAIRLGAVAGVARLVVSAPSLGLRDTVRVTVLPGAATAMRLAARDTTLYAGGVATLRPAAIDANGNVRDDPVVAEGDAPAVADVSVAGIVTGRGVGRVRVLLRTASLTDSAFVSVVPSGRLVTWVQNSAGLVEQLAMIDMDGTHLRALAPAGSHWGVYPVWSPSGDRIAFHTAEPNAGGDPTHVYTIDTLQTPALALTSAWGTRSYYPRFVATDEVEYLVLTGSRYDVYRVGADNTRARRLATLAEAPDAQIAAVDIAPDGARIVYTAVGGDLVLFDVAAGTTRHLGIRGDRPRWSPDGSLIAYRPGGVGLAVMRGDGTGARVLTPTTMGDALAWSPDGAYLLTRLPVVQPLPRLVRVSDGLVIPFAMPVSIYEPSWR